MRASLKYNKGENSYSTELLEESTTIDYTVQPNGNGRLSLTDIENHASLNLRLNAREAALLAHALISLVTEL
jgi:hypothetical protein